MPYIHRVKPAQRPDFVREAVDLYLQQNPIDADDLIHVKLASLLVKAGKNQVVRISLHSPSRFRAPGHRRVSP